jgi:glycosyltransferase involved in cell wall biosynthesis
MYPTRERPARGRFVADQVAALRNLPGTEIEVFAFAGGGDPRAYVRAATQLRRRYGGTSFEVVHAHFGLSLWPALAARADARAVTLHGTDLAHPRSRAITLAGLRSVDLVATVSEELGDQVPAWATGRRAQRAVLPCGLDVHRFSRIPRPAARVRLGLAPDTPYLLFPANPGRAEKRHDRAAAVARAAGVTLLALHDVAPDEVPLWINAASAVVAPSEREGFGLAVLEALACDVPVLATPVGIAPEALAGVPGTLCAEFDAAVWATALEPHLAAPDPRIPGRQVAERYSAERMAARVLAAWKAL